MNPLLKRLAALRWKVRLLDGWMGVCALIAGVVGFGLAVGFLDYWAHLPNFLRALALVGLLVGGGLVAFRFLVQPFLRSCDDLSLALRVEEKFPDLNDSLASTVQFLKQSKDDAARVGLSPALRERTIEQTLAKADACDFGRILDRRSGLLFGIAALSVLALAALAVSANRSYAAIAFWRLVEPYGEHTWTRVSVARLAPQRMLEEDRWESLSPDPRKADRIAIGRPYRIKVEVQGRLPKHAKLEIQGELIRSDKAIELKPGADKHSATFEQSIDMTQHYRKFKFRIVASDGSFPPRADSWHEVEVVPPPALVNLDGQPSPQLTLYPPAYSDLPSPQPLLPGTRHLEIWAGTNVLLRAKADRPLQEAWIEYEPEKPEHEKAALLAFLGQTAPIQAVAQAALSSAVWARFPAQLDNEGSVLTVRFMPWVSGRYALHLRDKDQLASHEAADLRVQLDPLPIVKLVQPGSSLTAHPKANVGFKFRVTDETFAIRSVYVEYRKKNPDGTDAGLPKRSVLYQAEDFGATLPAFLAQAAIASLPGPNLRPRFKQLDFDVVWPLGNENFQDGDLVVAEVCALDFCDIYATREPGRSHEVALRIISPKKITAEATRDLADIQLQLKNIEQLQKKALDTSNETHKADKIDEKVTEKFIDNGEQTQRRIQDTVGRTAGDGLRGDLAKIRQNLKDNQLTDTPAYRDAGKMKSVLDAIAKQELPQIEPKLAEIRNELTQNEKNKPATKTKLDETARLQKDVLSSLKELNKELDPSARMEEHRNKLREILDKQKNLKSELDQINASKRELDESNKDDAKLLDIIKKQFNEKVAAKAQEQRDLSMQTEKLIEELRAAKENFQKNDDPDNARKIDEALKVAEPPQPKQPEPRREDKQADPLTKRMKDAANGLDKKSEAPQKVLDEQKDIAKQLERTLDLLEGRPADVTKREIEKRQEAEKKIRDISRELKQLQDEAKKIDQIKDKEERLKAKEKLAEKHAQLQEKMKDLRRQLNRLEEERAADNLNQADNDLDKARDQIAKGGNPEEAQKEAQKKLKEAERDLKQAEEELARELLIKIADQLDGLKKRQDAQIGRTETLHEKVMKRKSWSDAFIDTLDGNADAQKTLADETDSFKEKLKQAKVFYSLLERVKDSMDKAGESMLTRKTELAVDRRYLEQDNGQRMDDKEVADEVEAQNITLKHQKQAARRLGIMVDSIKQELAKKKKPRPDPQEAQNDDPEKQPPEKKGGIPAADGIPSPAQLKVLKAEQLDLNERTEDFGKRHPDTADLNEQQLAELHELEVEQERLQELFGQLTAPPEAKEGVEP